jgi:hypothetical protein
MRDSFKIRRSLEISANTAIIVVSIIMVGNLVWSKWWPPKHELDSPKIGSKVSLPGIKWNEGTTLVLALQEGCRYCEESAAFYRRLRDQRVGAQPRMIAVVPGDKTQINRYLAEQHVFVDEAFNLSLSKINVSVTPTLLLLGKVGDVRNVWVGKLNQDEEKQVLEQMLLP